MSETRIAEKQDRITELLEITDELTGVYADLATLPEDHPYAPTDHWSVRMMVTLRTELDELLANA